MARWATLWRVLCCIAIRPGDGKRLPLPYRTDQRVALLEACLDADTALLQAVAALGYEGVVIAGFGAGHVSASWSEVLEHLAPTLPVLVATRTGRGPTARATYGFAGAEIDLQKRRLHGWATLPAQMPHLAVGCR